jgi:diguanylate cyclase (GGDEF)-like protein
MDILLHIVIVLEMIFVNCFVCYRFSKRRFSAFKTGMVLVLFTVCIIGLSLPLLRKSAGYGNGNGLFALIGMFYLIPFKFLYDQPVRTSAGIVCASWTFTMSIFSLSVQGARWLFPEQFALAVCLLQTVLYLCTSSWFFKFAKNRLMYLLDNLPQERQYLFVSMGIVWFLTILMINASLVLELPWLKPLIFVFLLYDAYTSYSFLHMVVESNNDIRRLEASLVKDDLTGLPNRYKLFEDIDAMISSRKPFKLTFLDLNDFKQVNDRHGHLAGDDYLRTFSQRLKSLYPKGLFYRMAGDEFIYLCKRSGDQAALYDDLEKLKGTLLIPQQEFLGVSYGTVSYPQDAMTTKELLAKADKAMYACKAERKDARRQ